MVRAGPGTLPAVRAIVPLRDIVDLVCGRLDVDRGELQDGTERHVVEAREVIYRLARRHTRLSWRAIVKRTTGQGHMAAMRACARPSARLEPVVAELSLELQRRARAGRVIA